MLVILNMKFNIVTVSNLFLLSSSQELELLGLLYGLFQKFLRFNDRFRESLWAEVDLDAETKEVSHPQHVRMRHATVR